MGLSRSGRIAARVIGASCAAVVVVAVGCLSIAADARAAEPSPASPAPASLVSAVTQQLARAGTIRSHFTQTQTLAAMNRPLVSTGSMLIDRALGIVWRIETPYRATYAITDGGVREIDASGQAVPASGGGRGVAQVSQMMRGMLSGDLSALYSQFDVEASGTPARWRMTLRPNQPQVRQALGVLRMTGGEFLNTLEIGYANGNRTTLEFNGTARVAAPSGQERAWLEAR
ncbi:outer membrane lipoprotein carrier protein LolA [Burkholderia sp. Ac-20379]|uniref:outer membrane lipoprotein carrier protein LolA n=1 Tax=Burkholderia sp. Ac-20379 TaxID=2703900 RepID=UPI0019802EF2|nr:outer membrane lipoprotein carrier protein LolA [Burkholderia sp. Ac-20379]MBN3726782.1 outer membrane lipoprotein carrier protein LolA [Burkholderia sp. Ac-20379]